MGSLCPSKAGNGENNRKVAPLIEIITKDHLADALNTEITFTQKRILELSTEITGMKYCEYLIEEIEVVPLSHLIKEFSDQRVFFQQQIGKFFPELCNHDYSLPELSDLLINYLCFVSYVQQNGVQVVISLWKEKKELISVNEAIDYYNSQFIKIGGKLRREFVSKSILLETKTPERFQKTREWIKKQAQNDDQ